MKLSKNGLKLVKEFEGFRSKPYLDSARVPTIGYGSTYYANGQIVTMNDDSITEDQASSLMLTVMGKYEKAVERYVQAHINQNQFDALVSFSYNVGIGALQKSTLLKKLNAGLYIEAAAEFKRWVYADGKVLDGLRNRRIKEKTLFLMPPVTFQHEFTDVQPKEKQMDLSEIIKTLFGTLLRHGANAIGAFLVAKGYVDADTATQLSSYIVGSGLIVIAAVASVFFKKKALDAQPTL